MKVVDVGWPKMKKIVADEKDSNELMRIQLDEVAVEKPLDEVAEWSKV